MATWAKGLDFKNSGNTKRIGGIGVYGSDSTAQKLYIGLGTEPWNNVGLQLTSSSINFKGNKIYHAGDKPTASEIGAAASSHTHSSLKSTDPVRPTSANLGVVADRSLSMMLSTSSMTTGKPLSDGYILNFNWDNNGGWASQLYVQNSSSPKMQVRGMNAGTWGEWNTLYGTNNKPTPAEIGAAASSHTHNYAGSSSAGGAATTALACTGNSATATTSNYLASNTRMDYGWNGVNYFNISGTAGAAAKANNTPTSAWWHVMRFNHANSSGYYTDLAIPFNDTSLYYKRITNGSVQNGGWVKVLDSLNYNSYSPTKTGGGASGTWGISVSGNANTATTLQTARTINGTSFNGSANITTANWGTARTITIGNTGKSVNGSGNISWSLSEIGAAASSHSHSNYVTTSGGQQISGDLGFTKTIKLYDKAKISFMQDAGQLYIDSGSIYSDGNGGVTFLTGKGVETSLNLSGYFNGINGFNKSFEVNASTQPTITLNPTTNPSENSGGRIVFKSADSQNVQLRHEWYDGALAPFGLIVEKATGNSQNHNAALKVEGAIQCGVNSSSGNPSLAGSSDARIVRGATDAVGSLKVQLGGSSPSFEIVNPAWSTAWFSCGSAGIRAISYSNFSDETLKTNIKEVKESISDKVNKIKIYNYNYKTDFDNEISTCRENSEPALLENMPEQRWGVIAQEIEELFPELINESETLIDGENKPVKSVDVYGLTVLTLEFAKELKQEIDLLKEDKNNIINEMTTKINNLIDRINMLEQKQ